MGCPITQNVSQKMILPTELPGYLLWRNLVIATKGTCIIIPINDHGTVTIWNGTETRISCKIADTVKTMSIATVLETFILIAGK